MQLVWTKLVYSLGQKFIHLYTPQHLTQLKLTRIMDYATALSEIGEEEQAYALKTSIKDDVARIDSLSASG